MEQSEKLSFDDIFQEIGISKKEYLSDLGLIIVTIINPSNHDVQIIAGFK